MGDAMEKDWRGALAELHSWASVREGIVLTPTETSVPKELREEFYGYVEDAQELLASEALADELARAEALAARVNVVRESICRATGIGCYRLAPRLEQFLAAPRRAAARPLQSLVLDALGGAVRPDDVCGEAAALLRSAMDALLRGAFEAWAYLGVVAALDPERLWAVVPAAGDAVMAVESDEIRAGWQLPSRELRVPEAVVRCSDGAVYAVRMECAREVDYYDALMPVARDTSAGGDTYELLTHRVLLVYRIPDEGAVAPVVNRKEKRQVPCDLAVSVLAPQEMGNPSYLGSFIARARKLQLKRPIQVLTYGDGAFPDAMEEDPAAPAVRVHRTGLSEDALTSVVEQALSEPAMYPVFRQQ